MHLILILVYKDWNNNSDITLHYWRSFFNNPWILNNKRLQLLLLNTLVLVLHYIHIHTSFWRGVLLWTTFDSHCIGNIGNKLLYWILTSNLTHTLQCIIALHCTRCLWGQRSGQENKSWKVWTWQIADPESRWWLPVWA